MARFTSLILAVLMALAATALAFNNEYQTGMTGLRQRAAPQAALQSRPARLPPAGKAALSEGFESIFLPAGWQAVNISGYETWSQSNTIAHSGSTYSAFINYQEIGGGDDWLITPPLYPQSTTDSITFWLQKQLTNPYPPDWLYIKVSTGDSAVGSFGAALLSIDVANLPAATWVRYAVSLGAYNGQRIFAAFHHQDTNGNGCYLDDVSGPDLSQPSVAHDLMVQSIDTPAAAIVTPGAPFHAVWTIRNAGTSPETDFVTYCNIYDSTGALLYSPSGGIISPDTLAPDAVRQFIAAADFTPDSLMRYRVIVYTDLPGDLRPSNDTLKFNFRTYDRDAGATTILAPGASVAPSANVTPRALFHNFATAPATFEAYFQIDSEDGPVYLESATITGLAPGTDQLVNFPVWAAPHDIGGHRMYAFTSQELDLNPANDTLRRNTMISYMGWTDITAAGAVATFWPGSCTDGAKLYFIGGLGTTGALLNKVQVYNPLSKGWSQPTTLPVAVYSPSCAVIGGRLYVIGGMNLSPAAENYTQIYNISGNSWSYGTAPISARGNCGGGVVDGKMYIVGGGADGSLPSDCPTYEYNPAADTTGGTPWATKAPCPRGGSGMILGAGFYGAPGLDRIYTGGDYRGTTDGMNLYYSYDPAGDAWTTIAAPPADVGGLSPGLAWNNDHAYLLGGDPTGKWTPPLSAKTYVYDPANDRWTDAAAPLSFARIGMGIGIIGNKLYTFGGSAGSNASNPPPFEWSYTLDYLGVAGKPAAVTAPGTFALYGNHPNPFRSATKIEYQLPKAGQVNLSVYSITGQLVKTLVSETQPAGRHSMNWNGKDNLGCAVSSGIYFYRLSANGSNATGKLVMLR